MEPTPPTVEYGTPAQGNGALALARLAEAAGFAGFVLLFIVVFAVSAVPSAWLAWALATAIVITAVMTPLLLARAAVRRAASSARADYAGRVARSAARARRSASVLMVLSALALCVLPNRIESFREARRVAAEAMLQAALDGTAQMQVIFASGAVPMDADLFERAAALARRAYDARSLIHPDAPSRLDAAERYLAEIKHLQGVFTHRYEEPRPFDPLPALMTHHVTLAQRKVALLKVETAKE